MCGATLSGSLFSQSSHSYHGFTVNPHRWEWCVRDSQRGEINFHNWNHVQKQAEGELRNNKTDQIMKKSFTFFDSSKGFQDLPRSWQLGFNRNQCFGGNKCCCLPPWPSTPLLRPASDRYPSPRCLSKPFDALIRAISASLPPSPVCSLYLGRINKTHSRFEDKCWLKGQAVFEQPGTKTSCWH